MIGDMAATILYKIRTLLLGKVLGIERHEYIGVAWSFVYFFCVLSSYYMLRPMREALGVDSGVASIPWLFSSTFVVMLGATSIFGWIASRFARRVFLPWVYIFFAVNILIFYGLFQFRGTGPLSKPTWENVHFTSPPKGQNDILLKPPPKALVVPE